MTIMSVVRTCSVNIKYRINFTYNGIRFKFGSFVRNKFVHLTNGTIFLYTNVLETISIILIFAQCSGVKLCFKRNVTF